MSLLKIKSNRYQSLNTCTWFMSFVPFSLFFLFHLIPTYEFKSLFRSKLQDSSKHLFFFLGRCMRDESRLEWIQLVSWTSKLCYNGQLIVAWLQFCWICYLTCHTIRGYTWHVWHLNHRRFLSESLDSINHHNQ